MLCVCACVCVCDWGWGWTNSFQNQADGRGGGGGGGGGGGRVEMANVAPIVDKLFKNSSRFQSKTQVTPLIFASKSIFSDHLHASIGSHHPHFKTHGPGFLSLD